MQKQVQMELNDNQGWTLRAFTYGKPLFNAFFNVIILTI